ncbi:MAG: cytochrome c oxidase assembly protein [bacterium]
MLKTWEWYPSVVVGCALLAAAYGVLVRPLRPLRVLSFLGGTLLLLLTLVGPLDGLGDEYLFSAHMLEHLMLLVAVPPLLILGIPPEAASRLLEFKPAAAVERLLNRPALAWLLAMSVLYLWHVPTLYNATLADERVHIFEHLSFLVTATIFWWPVLAPLRRHRLRGPFAILYLFLAAVANSVLGAILTFAKPGLYPLYDRPANGSTELRFIREVWGLDPAADQQLGGLFMWVVGGFFFLLAILGMYARWYRESGSEGTP